MARKDIFDRIDSKMRSQMASLGRTKKEESTDDSEYVEKRVNRRVIRRRARKPAPGEEAALESLEATADAPPEEEISVSEDAATASLEAPAPDVEPAAAEVTDEPESSIEEDAGPADEAEVAPPEVDEPAATVDVEEAEPQAADEPELAEAADEPELVAESEVADEPAVAEETPEVAEVADESTAEVTEPEETPDEPADVPDDVAEPSTEDAAPDTDEIVEPAVDEAVEAVPDVEVEEAAVQAAPSGDPATTGDESEDGENSVELEDLLREQGIVQHRPRKGRRIIAEAPMPDRRPITKPIIRQDIRAQQMLKQARQAGYGEDAQPAGQPRDGGRRRTPNAGRMERDLREERAREQKMARTPARGRKGRRKSIVQRPDMVFYPDRRSTRKKAPPKRGPGRAVQITTPKAAKRVIRIENEISVGELAKELGIKATELIHKFIEMGQMVTLNQFIDLDAATLVAGEFDYRVENVAFQEDAVIVAGEDNPEDLVDRPPVITVMGHVDHGKTSILDTIRNTRVAAREAGGITQHIGAYQVVVGGQTLTFLDTPGHEAFTAMRARGAQCTDLVVLVVAANDGVMPQTIEAINHARAAGVPILVAINKIDLANKNIDLVLTGLSEHDLTPEDWGGDTVMVQVSATKDIGIDDLLEMIALQSEVLELKANPGGAVAAVVIEGQLSKGVGPVATVLVQRGTLHVGDFIVAGTAFGKIRAMRDFAGKPIKVATPSTPVEVHGLSAVPDAGDEVVGVEDERDAKQLAEHRLAQLRDMSLAKSSRATMDTLTEMLAAIDRKDLNIVLKADVHGSVEAVREALSKIDVDNTALHILHTAVGGITENDVTLASASDGMILGFNVRPDTNAARLAEQFGVEIRTYRVIYEALEEVQKLLLGLLDPILEEEVKGRAEVRDVFKIPKIGAIAGCHVADGTVARNHRARLLRDGTVVWEGKMGSLKRFKDDVKEVAQGYECGIGLHDFNDVKKGDAIETYVINEVAHTLS